MVPTRRLHPLLNRVPRRLAVAAMLLLCVAVLSAATPPAADGVSFAAVASLPKATKVNRIVVPRVKINMPIQQGKIGGTIRNKVAYHYPGTSWPGGRSNTYFYAHARAGSFLNLKKMRKGDVIQLRLVSGQWVRYKVTLVKKVKWNDGRWTLLTSSERLTLQTCTGNTKTAPRLVVVAVPIK